MIAINVAVWRLGEMFGDIRAIERDGEPWFVGKDVAVALGYESPRAAVSKKVDDEDLGVSKMETPSGNQEMIIINESGLYSLVLSSKLPQAKQFKHWVTAEVLPTIRRHGAYVTTPTMKLITSRIRNLASLLVLHLSTCRGGLYGRPVGRQTESLHLFLTHNHV